MIAIRKHHPQDPSLEKLLSDNRDRYVAQSAATKCGQVAPLPPIKNARLFVRLVREPLLLSWEGSK
jgi:hypothetical protein